MDPDVMSQSIALPPKEDLEDVSISWKKFVAKNKKVKIEDVYQIEGKLGEGSYGMVRKATQKNTNIKRSIKFVKRNKLSKTDKSKFLQEVTILNEMDHPNIARLVEFYQDKQHFYLVNELCEGGELFDFLILNRFLSEVTAVQIITQILRAVAYAHLKGIVHRDLKPENLMLDQPCHHSAEKLHLKIIDWGTSTFMSPGRKLRNKLGTALYIAPEVLRQGYNEKCDIWSIGIILYLLLCGYPPFRGKDEKTVLDQVKNHPLVFPAKDWVQVSANAKDLVTKMIERDVDNRWSAEKCLQHPWITQSLDSIDTHNINLGSIQNLKNFSADRKLQQAALQYISHTSLQTNEIRKMKSTFYHFDMDGDGRVSIDELQEGLQKHISDMSGEEIQEIMAMADTDKNGYIDYSEFLMAAMDKRKVLNQHNLEKAFSLFDQDGNGSITADEVRNILGHLDSDDKGEWDRIIREVDIDGNGEIDLKEFRTMMMKLY